LVCHKVRKHLYFNSSCENICTTIILTQRISTWDAYATSSCANNPNEVGPASNLSRLQKLYSNPNVAKQNFRPRAGWAAPRVVGETPNNHRDSNLKCNWCSKASHLAMLLQKYTLQHPYAYAYTHTQAKQSSRRNLS